ncbi:Rha family transcriptional regulator [Weissella confusa]
MEDLVMYGTPAEGVYTTSEIVAKYTGVSFEHVGKLTRQYRSDLEKFGKLVFEIRPLPSGQIQKIWHYNEPQATLLITFMRNTPAVIEFKSNLVMAFYSQRKELVDKTIALANIKPVNRSLSEVVHEVWADNPHMYSTIHNLALKVVTGKNAKQLKEAFEVKDVKQALTSFQIEHLERVKELIKQLILNGYTYQEIKVTVLKERGAVNA